MEKESNIYYYKYINYKKKYLQAKKFLGGALYESPPPKNSMPKYGHTSETDRYYHKFYESFTITVLECIQYEANKNQMRIRIRDKKSGIYFEFDDVNYLTVHNDKGTNNKFHIHQNGHRNNLGLAISYDNNGDLEIIKKYDDQYFWNNINPKFKDLLDIIENCVNKFKIKPDGVRLNFNEGTGAEGV